MCLSVYNNNNNIKYFNDLILLAANLNNLLIIIVTIQSDILESSQCECGGILIAWKKLFHI